MTFFPYVIREKRRKQGEKYKVSKQEEKNYEKGFYSDEQLEATYSNTFWVLIYFFMKIMYLDVIMTNRDVICCIAVLGNIFVAESNLSENPPLCMCVCVCV